MYLINIVTVRKSRFQPNHKYTQSLWISGQRHRDSVCLFAVNCLSIVCYSQWPRVLEREISALLTQTQENDA